MAEDGPFNCFPKWATRPQAGGANSESRWGVRRWPFSKIGNRSKKAGRQGWEGGGGERGAVSGRRRAKNAAARGTDYCFHADDAGGCWGKWEEEEEPGKRKEAGGGAPGSFFCWSGGGGGGRARGPIERGPLRTLAERKRIRLDEGAEGCLAMTRVRGGGRGNAIQSDFQVFFRSGRYEYSLWLPVGWRHFITPLSPLHPSPGGVFPFPCSRRLLILPLLASTRRKLGAFSRKVRAGTLSSRLPILSSGLPEQNPHVSFLPLSYLRTPLRRARPASVP